MDADTAQLAAVVERIRALDGVGVAIAEDAQPAVLEEAKRTAAAGTTADGNAWAPTRKGERALKNAAAAISIAVSGASRAVLTLILRGPEVYHQNAKGTGKYGLPKRAVLFDPANGVPAKMRDAIAASARKVIARAMGGSR